MYFESVVRSVEDTPACLAECFGDERRPQIGTKADPLSIQECLNELLEKVIREAAHVATLFPGSSLQDGGPLSSFERAAGKEDWERRLRCCLSVSPIYRQGVDCAD